MTRTTKTLTIALLAGGVASCSYAQGNYNFFTYNATSSKGGVLQASPSTQAVPNGTYGQLFYSLYASTSSALSPLSPVETFNNGVINVGTLVDPVDDAGTTIWYELVVWNAGAGNSATAALGSTFLAKGNAAGSTVVDGNGLTFFGKSAYTKINNLGGIDAAMDPPYNVPQINGYATFNVTSVAPVPEPTTIVLGGLGAAALLAFRRRK
jgi:PEP-CTERM motif-containing protein